MELESALRENLSGHPENVALEPKWTIGKSPLGGRGLFATDHIATGELIFVNSPLLVGVRADYAGATFCTRCYTVTNACFTCAKCNLSVCSEMCQNTAQHRSECEIISKWIKKCDEFDISAILLKNLMYLRALLLNDNDKFILLNLQTDDTDLNRDELKELRLVYEIPDEDIDVLNLVKSLMNINVFRVSQQSGEVKVPIRGLYPASALVNHSCVPNTRNLVDFKKRMWVIASKDIPKGAEILTCYTGLLWGTPARRHQLYKTKCFWCNCLRCSDPKELHSNLAALKCTSAECSGVLLPKEPLKYASVWVCDICSESVSSRQISVIQSILGSLLGTVDMENLAQLETLVLRRIASFVPYSSQIFVDLKMRLTLKLGFADGHRLTELSTHRLALKERLCRELVALTSALRTGAAHLRGLLLYHLHATLAERARRDNRLYQELKGEIESSIEEAYEILRGDVSAPGDLALRRRYLGPVSDLAAADRFSILET